MNDPKNMTNEELRSYLLTCDGKGKDFKARVLDEIIQRERENLGYSSGDYGEEDSSFSMMG